MRSLPILSPSKPGYPTASELYRARECIAPWALGLPEVRETNEYAEEGRELHWWAEQTARGYLHEHPSPPEKYVARLRHVREALAADFGSAKWARPDHKVLIEQGIKWRPGVLEDEVALCERQPGERLRGWFSGTADLVYVRTDGLLVVADWKFGPREAITGEPAKDSCQGFFLATAFAALLGIRGSSSGVVVARFERRMVSDDGIEVDAVDITQGELDDFAEQLRGLAQRIEAAEGATPRISAACGKCKAKSACPAWSALELALYAEALENAVDLINGPPRDAEHAREYRDGIAALERAKEDLEERYRAFLVQNPDGVPLGLGMREVARKVERPNLVLTDAAQAKIREKWGEAAFVARPSIGRIRAAEKVKLSRPSKADWDKRKAALAEEMREMGLLLTPSVSTRLVVQQMKKDKWVDCRVESDEESED